MKHSLKIVLLFNLFNLSYVKTEGFTNLATINSSDDNAIPDFSFGGLLGSDSGPLFRDAEKGGFKGSIIPSYTWTQHEKYWFDWSQAPKKIIVYYGMSTIWQWNPMTQNPLEYLNMSDSKGRTRMQPRQFAMNANNRYTTSTEEAFVLPSNAMSLMQRSQVKLQTAQANAANNATNAPISLSSSVSNTGATPLSESSISGGLLTGVVAPGIAGPTLANLLGCMYFVADKKTLMGVKAPGQTDFGTAHVFSSSMHIFEKNFARIAVWYYNSKLENEFNAAVLANPPLVNAILKQKSLQGYLKKKQSNTGVNLLDALNQAISAASAE